VADQGVYRKMTDIKTYLGELLSYFSIGTEPSFCGYHNEHSGFKKGDHSGDNQLLKKDFAPCS
jgi:hypothetical protein